ncbi:hypothetical protein ACILE2_01740 [Capnocytophaga canimorsus]|uniref:hypothetical protein n=1 Tax=Capnocytophaga canimorsus TaxID=28188 RepID=UPI0037D4A1A6
MEIQENKVKILINAEGDLNDTDNFNLHLVLEGGMLQLSCTLAGLLKRENEFRKVVEKALEIVYKNE